MPKKSLFFVFVLALALMLLSALMPAATLAAKLPNPTPTPVGADGPDGLPDSKSASRPQVSAQSAAAGSAGETKVTYQLPDVTLTVSDGYDLDQYLFRSSSPIAFDMDMQGFSLAPGQMAILTLRVWDVDQNGTPGYPPEVDKVYVNDFYLGNLTGADSQ